MWFLGVSMRVFWAEHVIQCIRQSSFSLPSVGGLHLIHWRPEGNKKDGGRRNLASLVAQMVKNLPAMQGTRVWSLGQEDPLEKGMATHSSILAWRIPWTEKPSGLQSTGLQRVRPNWATNTHTHTEICTFRLLGSVTQSFPTLCDPLDCSPPDSSLRDFPGKNTGVGCLSSSRRLNLRLLHLLHWQGPPRKTYHCLLEFLLLLGGDLHRWLPETQGRSLNVEDLWTQTGTTPWSFLGLQTTELLSLHDYMSKFLIINQLLCTPYWFSFSGNPD